MTRRSCAIIASLLIGLTAAGMGLPPAARGAGAAPASAPAPGKRFDHQQHAALTPPVVTSETCARCHGRDPGGVLAVPGASGHQPCLDAGCHVDDFLATGDSTRRSQVPEDQVRYRRATAFCLGCHSSPDGRPPARFTRAKADVIYANHPSPDYHVEMDHWAHTGRAACRDCHLVNTHTLALQPAAPGHSECARCHGRATTPAAKPMTDCLSCHRQPGPAAYFSTRRKGSEVRSCGSPGHLALARRRNQEPQDVPCFQHEIAGHRFRDTERAAALQCGDCHFMFAHRATWTRAARYQSLRDIAALPVIHNQRDRAHASCGAAGSCHARDVSDVRGTARCTLCHNQQTIDKGLFE